jgi:hypothetical protein
MKKTDPQMLKALASYTGRVTPCPPGVARNADLNRRSRGRIRWLYAKAARRKKEFPAK